MNTSILDKYKIQFSVVNNSDGKHLMVESIIPTDINYYLTGYLLYAHPNFLLDELLPEVDKALAGNEFDEDGGGTIVFLTLGHTLSNFSSDNEASIPANIPTSDLKEIILS